MLTKRRGRPLQGLEAVIDPDLREWGEYARKRDRAPGDWPEETSLSKFAREGFHGAGQSGGGEQPMPDRLLAVDVAIATLSPRPRKAVDLFYRRHGCNEKLAAYAFGRGNRWFRMCLKEGRRTLAVILLPN